MPWRPPSGVVADHLWNAYSGRLLLAGHGLALAICVWQAAACPVHPLLNGLAAALHGLALNACIRSKDAQKRDPLGRKLASYCSIVAWGAANAGWMIVSAAPTASWTHHRSTGQISVVLSTIVGNLLLNTIEQVHALMLAPGAVVAAGLAWHLHVLHTVLKVNSVELPLPGIIIWWLLSLATPHLLHWYMYTQVRSPEARAAAAKALKTAGQTRIAPPLVPLRIGPPQAGSHPPPPRALIHRRVTPEPSAAASLQPSGSQSPLEKHVMPEGGHRPAQLQDAVTQTDEWLLPAAPEPPPPPARSHDMTQAAESQPQSVPAATEHQPAAAENPVVPGHPLTVAAVQQHVRMLHSASVESFSVLGLSGRVTSTEQLLGARQQLLSSVPSSEALHALQHTRDLVRRGSARRYQSRLAQPQVVIKVEGAEPEELGSSVVADVDTMLRVMGHVGFLVSRASARRGCCLLTFDLMGPKTPSADSFTLLDGNAEAWLRALVNSGGGAHMQDGSHAVLMAGGQQMEATWQAEHDAWAVAPPTLVGPNASKMLSLLYVDHPVVRLPAVHDAHSTAADDINPSEPAAFYDAVSTSSAGSSAHRVTVVMGLQQGCPPPCFVGSDTSASAAHSTDTSDETGKVVPVVQCVARGSFGTYLAVAVASVTVAAPSDGTTKDEGGMPAGDTSDGAAGCGGASTTCSSGGSADSAAGVQLSVTQALGDDDDRCPTNWPTHIAITLDVDLSSAPHAGLAQLELWHGRTLLLSAPLLLLPPVMLGSTGVTHDAGGGNNSDEGDPLVAEIQRFTQTCSWQQQDEDVGGVGHNSEGISGTGGAEGAVGAGSSITGAISRTNSPFANALGNQPLAPQMGPSGMAAWLCDLGQLVHAVEGIHVLGLSQHAWTRRNEDGPEGGGHITAASGAAHLPGHTSDNGDDTESVSESSSPGEDLQHHPESWGGIAGSLAWRHAHDPHLLTTLLLLAEGLADHAALEGQVHVGALVASATRTIQQRLRQLQGTASLPGDVTTHQLTVMSLSSESQQLRDIDLLAATTPMSPAPATSGHRSSLPRGACGCGAHNSLRAPRDDESEAPTQGGVHTSGVPSLAALHLASTSRDAPSIHPTHSPPSTPSRKSSLASGQRPSGASRSSTPIDQGTPRSLAPLTSVPAVAPAPGPRPTPARPPAPRDRSRLPKMQQRGTSMRSASSAPAEATSGNTTSAVASAAAGAVSTVGDGAQQSAGGVTPGTCKQLLKEAVCGLVLGFHPEEQEKAYAAWLSNRSGGLASSWCLMVLIMWLCVCAIRSAQQGLTALMPHLPVHMIVLLPFAVGALLEFSRYRRWQEGLLVMQAVGRAMATCAAAANLLAPQASYAGGLKVLLDAWGGLLEVCFTPARLPALVCSQAALVAVSLAYLEVCAQEQVHWQDWLVRALIPRCAIVTLGTSLDLVHRCTFLHQRLGHPHHAA